MPRQFPILVVSALLACCACGSRDVVPAGHVPFDLPVVVLVEGTTGYGSGVVIADGWVLTVAHALPAEKAGGLPVVEEIRHPSADLALLRVPGIRGSVKFATAAPCEGDRVYAAGWHLSRHLLITDGWQGREPDWISAETIHGCSGGPVLNARGELVGIASMVGYAPTDSGMDGYAITHVARYTPLTGAEQGWILYTANL